MIRDARMHRSPRSWKYSYTRLKKASRSEIASHRSSGPSPRISATGSISISISCSFWRRGAAVVWEDVIFVAASLRTVAELVAKVCDLNAKPAAPSKSSSSMIAPAARLRPPRAAAAPHRGPRAAAALHRRPRAEFARRRPASTHSLPRFACWVIFTIPTSTRSPILRWRACAHLEGSGTPIRRATSSRRRTSSALAQRVVVRREAAVRVGDTRRTSSSTATRAPCAPPRCTCTSVPPPRGSSRGGGESNFDWESFVDLAIVEPDEALPARRRVNGDALSHDLTVGFGDVVALDARAAVDRTRRRRRGRRGHTPHPLASRVALGGPAGADLIDCFGQPATAWPPRALPAARYLALERFSWDGARRPRRRLRRPAARRLRHRRRRRVLRRRAGGGGKIDGCGVEGSRGVYTPVAPFVGWTKK